MSNRARQLRAAKIDEAVRIISERQDDAVHADIQRERDLLKKLTKPVHLYRLSEDENPE